MLISKPKTYQPTDAVVNGDLNNNWDTIYNDYNGNITDANIAAAANILWTKISKANSVIGDVANVNVPSPSDGDVLTYDNASSKWVNRTAGAAVVPSGTIMFGGWAYNSLPSGFLLCDGSAVSRTTYATLFTAISTRFGVGDTTTTFNLPNLIAKFPQGIATSTTNPGASGGAVNKTTGNASADFNTASGGGVSRTSSAHTHDISDIRPPYLELTPVIKA